MSLNHGNRHTAEVKYRSIRQDAMDVLTIELSGLFDGKVRFTDINSNAIGMAMAWRNQYSTVGKQAHEPAWEWEKEVLRFRRRPRRVELAIWHNVQLCGLVLGRISDKCVVATIHLIEANPNQHPLSSSVAPIATRYLELLATSLEIKEVSVEAPIPELISFYKKLGFIKEVRKGQKVLRLKRSIEV